MLAAKEKENAIDARNFTYIDVTKIEYEKYKTQKGTKHNAAYEISIAG
jgi:hypothetical protein